MSNVNVAEPVYRGIPIGVFREIQAEHRRLIQRASGRRIYRRMTAEQKATRRASRVRWLQKHRVRLVASKREWRQKNVVLALLAGARCSAKRLGRAFNIRAEDVPTIGAVCPIFGLPFASLGLYDDRTPSIDRIDSSKGYVKGNVWIIGRRANRIKNDGTAGEHEAIARAMRAKGVR